MSKPKRFIPLDELIEYAKLVDGNPYKVCEHFFGEITSKHITYLRNKVYNAKIKDILKPCSECPEFLEIQKRAIEKQKNHNLEKYGVEYYFNSEEFNNKKTEFLNKYFVKNVMQIPEIKKKNKESCLKNNGYECALTDKNKLEEIKKTNLEKYGEEYYMRTKDFREKTKQYYNKNYGTDWFVETEEFKKKSTESNLTKYGYEQILSCPEIQEYYKKLRAEKLGVEYPAQNPEFLEKIKNTNFKNYGVYNYKQKDYPDYIKPATYDDNYLLKMIEGINTYEELYAKYLDDANIINRLLFRLDKQFEMNHIQSYGELRIQSYLAKNNFNFIEQYSFEDCKNVNPLRFDFAVFNEYNNLECLIEFDGEQHFRFVEFFHVTEEGFNKQKYWDNYKNEYCKRNNIKLYRIPYWDFDNIENILENILYNCIEENMENLNEY